ncbi:hypothetical protein [Flavobacterium sp. UBA4197]|uniref:hypothetical protein n=1 Tax=Flavobacterium sp. UBA4197 TaxID=1946546 RepID=UPI002580690A|nr:hypothetical protein [Flavobacterium sp. UBA4197]
MDTTIEYLKKGNFVYKVTPTYVHEIDLELIDFGIVKIVIKHKHHVRIAYYTGAKKISEKCYKKYEKIALKITQS